MDERPIPFPAEEPASPSDIARLERLAADALPVLEDARLGGWRLRANGGVTRRGNSVLAEALPDRAALEAVSAVEAFYRERGLPSRFQLSRASVPSGLDGILAARGYRLEPGALVLVAPLERVADRAGAPGAGVEVRVRGRVDDAWLAARASAEAGSASDATRVRAATFSRREGSLFASATLDGEPAAAALGVPGAGDGADAIGIFEVATRPEVRRRGLARALFGAVARGGLERGARSAYLQVGEANEDALALYAALGFDVAYRYRYRVRDLGEGAGRTHALASG